MSIEQPGEFSPQPQPLPQVPRPTYGERINRHATNRQFNALDRNLQKTGLQRWLAEHDPEPDSNGVGSPWEGFTAITDELVGINPIDKDGTGSTHTVLYFENEWRRDDFNDMYDMLLSGIPLKANEPRPYFRRGEESNALEAYNLTYPYLSTAARVGDLLLRRANKGQPYLHEMTAWPIFRQQEAGIVELWPEKVQERIAHLADEFTPASLVSSGHLTLIGRQLRQFAREEGTTDQLKTHNPLEERPEIERGTHFFTTKIGEISTAAVNELDDGLAALKEADPWCTTEMLMSGASLGQELWAQFSERGAELKELYHQRKLVRLGQQLWELASGLGIAEGAGAAAEALITVSGALGVATYGTIADKIRDMRQK